MEKYQQTSEFFLHGKVNKRVELVGILHARRDRIESQSSIH